MTTPQTESRVLTHAQLKAAGACAEQRAKFRALFGREVLVTAEVCTAHAAVFDWDWAAQHLLGAEGRVAYEAATAPAWAAYEAATAPAWAAYEAATATAWAAYEAATATAWAAYEAATAPAWAAYEAARDTAWAAYEAATATAFASCYLAEG